ncbi:MAG: alpha-E domain-containing protein [Cycloclasticus sp.]|nr:alpha-E domain-containing protein [Cycloclasticus sp.]MBQ0790316.1 alpha-E domain-containing protein [Cycloclasticus sp.]
MLSRVGERIYWMARYLERVEDIARLINVHTVLLMDLPEQDEINWFTLIKIFNNEAAYLEQFEHVDEKNIMSFLVADLTNPSSLINVLSQARENARTSLDVLPEEAWEQINELSLMVKASLSAIGNRRRRQNMLLKIMERCQCISGIIDNHMSRNFAYDFTQIGKHIERADMTSRILEMTSLLASDTRGEQVRLHEGILWANLLKALSAQQMYLYEKRTSVSADKALDFLITDRSFPRSLCFSLAIISNYFNYLPDPSEPIALQEQILKNLSAYNPSIIPAADAHIFMDAFQVRLAELHQIVSDKWFHPDFATI